MKRRKKIILFTGVIIFLSIFIITFTQREFFSRVLSRYVSQAITKIADKEISIGYISPQGFNKILIKDFKIGKIFYCEKLEIGYRLRDIIRKRNFLDSIYFVKIYRPSLLLAPSQRVSPPPSPHPKKPPSPLPSKIPFFDKLDRIKIEVEEGSLLWRDRVNKFEFKLKKLRALINPTQRSLIIIGACGTSRSNFWVKGKYDFSQREFKIKFQAHRIEAREAIKITQPGVEILGGRLSLKGEICQARKSYSQGKIKISQGKIALHPKLPPLREINGEVNFENGLFTLSPLRANFSQGLLLAKVKKTQKETYLKVNLKKIPLRVFNHFLKYPILGGAPDVTLNVRKERVTGEIKGDFKVEKALLTKALLEKLSGRFWLKKENLEVKFDRCQIEGGKVEFRGVFPLKQPLKGNFEGEFEKINLSWLSKKYNFKGSLSGHFSSAPNKEEFFLKLKTSPLRIGEFPLAPFEGRIEIKEDKLYTYFSSREQNYLFSGNIENLLTPSPFTFTLRINYLPLPLLVSFLPPRPFREKPQGWLKLTASLTGTPSQTDLKLLASFEESNILRGKLQVMGSGSLKDRSFEIDLSGKDLKAQGKLPLGLKSKILISREEIQIKEFRLGEEEIRVKGNVSLPERAFKHTLITLNTSFNLLSTLPYFNTFSDKIRGKVKGKLEVTRDFKTPEIKGYLKLRNSEFWKIKLGNLGLTFHLKNRLLKFSPLKVNRDKVTLSGEFNLSGQKKKFSSLITLREFEGIKGASITGKLHLGGSISRRETEFKLLLQELWLNKVPQEKFLVIGRYDRKKFELKLVPPGDISQRYVSFSFLKSELQGNLFFKDFKLSSLSKAFFPNNISHFLEANLDGKLTFTGKLQNPIFRGDLELTQNLKYYDRVNISLRGSSQKLTLSKVLIKKARGEISLAGEIKLAYPIFAQVEWTAKAFEIKGEKLSAQGKLRVLRTRLRERSYIVNKISNIKTEGLRRNLTIDKLNFSFKTSPPGTWTTCLSLRGIAFKLNELAGTTEQVILSSSAKKEEGQGWFIVKNFSLPQTKVKESISKFKFWKQGIKFLPTQSNASFLGKVELQEKKINFDDFKLIVDAQPILRVKGYLSPDKLKCEVEGSNINSQLLSALYGDTNLLSGRLFFKLLLQGTPHLPYFRSVVKIGQGKVRNLKFEILRGHLWLTQNEINLAPINIGLGKEYNVEFYATLPLISFSKSGFKLDREKPLRIDLIVNRGLLKIIENIQREVLWASPEGEAEFYIRGSLNQPLISGYISVVNGRLKLSQYIQEVKGFNLQASIDKSIGTLSLFRANIGKGKIIIRGHPEKPDFVFDKWSLAEANLEIKTTRRGIRLNIPPYLEKKDYGYFVLGGNREGMKLRIDKDIISLTGEVHCSNFTFSYPPKVKVSETQPAKEVRQGKRRKVRKWQYKIKLTVGRNVWYELKEGYLPGASFSLLACVTPQSWVILKGEGGKTTVTGEITSRKGVLEYCGRTFRILEASARFITLDGETKTLVKGEAKCRFPNVERVTKDGETLRKVTEDYTVYLSVPECPAEEIRINLRSVPPLGEKELLFLVAFARVDWWEASLSEKGERAMSTLAEWVISSPIERAASKVKETFNLDVVKITPHLPPFKLAEIEVKKLPKILTQPGTTLNVVFGKYLLGGSFFIQFQSKLEIEAGTDWLGRKYKFEHGIGAEYELMPNFLIKSAWAPHLGELQESNFEIGVEYRLNF
jgi:hypothetical protein